MDSVQSVGALCHEPPAATMRENHDMETLSDDNDETVVAKTLVEISAKPPLLETSADIREVAEDMPRLERKDAAGSVVVNNPVESRSPSPPTLHHKDVVDSLTELDQSEHNSHNSPLLSFCNQESEEEMEEVDVEGGKLAPGNDVFLGTSMGDSSAGESGRSSTIATLRQRAGECAVEMADGSSEKALELCTSRDFADSNDEMLQNGFSGSELSIPSGSPTMMSDVESDDNTTMIGKLFDASEAECDPAVDENSKQVEDDADQSCDSDMLATPTENERSSSELNLNTGNGDAADEPVQTERSTTDSFSAPVAERESTVEILLSSSVVGSESNAFDGNSFPAVSKEPLRAELGDASVTLKSNSLVQNLTTTSVLEKLLNEPTHVPSPARNGPAISTAIEPRSNQAVHRVELNATSATLGAVVGANGSVEVESHSSRPSRQLSGDPLHLVVRSPADIGQPLAGSQHSFVASPASSSTAAQMVQFAPSFVNVGSPSLAGNVPHGSCPTPGMENVGSPYPVGYRRLSSGSGSHIQSHLVSPEMNMADQRMHSPASYCADYASAKQGGYAMRPLHDSSYQSTGGGPHSVKSSPGAAAGSPGSCAILSPNGNYGRPQSFGSMAHSPAARIDQSPASAGSGGFGSSFSQPNPSPLGSVATGRAGASGMPNRSPVGSANVFSPAPAATLSPSVMATSAASTLSTPLQHSSIAQFSCSPPDAGPPFHFSTNVAVPVSATTYANAPSPTPHSLQLLSPSNTHQSAGYQTGFSGPNPPRRHPSHHQQLNSPSLGLPYYGMLPSPPVSMSYAGMIDRRFSDAPMFSNTPSGRQTAPVGRSMPSDCSLIQLQQLTNRLSDQAVQPPLDMSYAVSASQPMGLVWAKSDAFARGVSGATVNQACKQSGRGRTSAAADKSSAGSIPSVPLLPPHATSYNMLGMFPSQHQPVPHATSPLDYQRYLANAGFFGQGASQLPMQMMPFGPPSSRSSMPFTLQPSPQTQGGNQMYSYSYSHVPSNSFTDLPRR